VRPLALQVENLSSFRGKQPSLDFSECELFAISGPTGSGKSSLLDAMVFALYGNIPRVGKSCSEMISLGGDRLAVVFDFKLGGRSYRVTRVLRRGKGTDAQIEDISGTEPRPIADGVRAVDAEIGRLLGLNFDAFIQCVILPQGDFARFLKSQPGDRREILRKLLRFTIYERMRVKAGQDAGTLGAQIRTKREFCDQHLADATPETIAGLEEQSANLVARNATSAIELQSEEEALVALRERNRLTRELREVRAALRTLEARKDAVEGDEIRARDAGRAAAVIPALDASEQAAERARQTRLQAEAAEATLEKAQKAHAEASAALNSANVAAAELPALEGRLHVLTAAITLLKPLGAIRQRIKEVTEALRAEEGEITKHRNAVESAQAALARLAGEVERFRDATGKFGYDADRHHRLHSLVPQSSAVCAERLVLKNAKDRAHAAYERHRALAAAVGRAVEVGARADEALARAEASRQTADEALDRATRDDMASHLRSTLHEGSPCPVCEHTVSRIPGTPAAPALESLKSALRASESALKTARLEATAAHTAATTAKTQATEAEQATNQTAADEASSLARLTTLVVQLTASAKGDLDLGETDSPEARLSDELAALETARQEHVAAVARHMEAETRLTAANTAATAAQQKVDLLSTSIRHQREELDRATNEARGFEEQLIASGTTNPEAEQKAVSGRQRAIREALELARSGGAAAREQLAAAQAKAEETRRSAADYLVAANDAEREASQALQKGGFDNGDRARRAFLTHDQIEELHRAIREYQQKRHAHSQRGVELEKALGGGEVEDSAVQSLSDVIDQRRQRHKTDVNEQVRLDQRLIDLRTRAAQAAQLRVELADLERRHAVQEQLATDLGGPRFQEFLLRQILRELTDGASARLQKLTSRYGFDLDDNNFVVIDYDSAGERRSAHTLSGGETFLASLALALELSEQIRRAAGALDLDSLFIDEGFGTLDAETLDTVTSAIESLKITGRMVGVITHIQELTARFPIQLHVSKGSNGARVEVRHA
jgi:exonuclease SbcC